MKTILFRSSAWLGALLFCTISVYAQSSTPVAQVQVVGTGQAAAYPSRFHGRLTASGERYNHHGLTAAHRALPMGTYLRVENLDNGQVAVVRINDRGPYVGDRMIDISGEAARRLGIAEEAAANVRLSITNDAAYTAATAAPATPAPAATTATAVPVPANAATPTTAASPIATAETGHTGTPQYAVQIGSFQDLQAAVALVNGVSGAWIHQVTVDTRRYYRVHYGIFASAAAAETARQSMTTPNGFVKRIDEGASVLAAATSSPAAPASTAAPVTLSAPTPAVVPPVATPATPAAPVVHPEEADKAGFKTWGERSLKKSTTGPGE